MEYQTNQMCNFCNKFKKTCNGRMEELFKPSVNHYCPDFEDRIYTQEQEHKGWHLKDFVDYKSNKNQK